MRSLLRQSDNASYEKKFPFAKDFLIYGQKKSLEKSRFNSKASQAVPALCQSFLHSDRPHGTKAPMPCAQQIIERNVTVRLKVTPQCESIVSTNRSPAVLVNEVAMPVKVADVLPRNPAVGPKVERVPVRPTAYCAQKRCFCNRLERKLRGKTTWSGWRHDDISLSRKGVASGAGPFPKIKSKGAVLKRKGGTSV